ncbi:MAG: hypothetical protein HY079_02250 [Elusimicrobia bacterium]|nr:hypothetical protein [Elusimicrobiota bacterium]
MRARSLAAAALAAALAACASPESRIRAHRAEFDAYPRAVQEKIRAGQVDVGFTRQQVALALGRPDRTYHRRTATATREVWAYGGGAARSSVSVGFGMGAGSMGPGYGGELGLGLADDAWEDRVRVVFENGVVVTVEDRGGS